MPRVVIGVVVPLLGLSVAACSPQQASQASDSAFLNTEEAMGLMPPTLEISSRSTTLQLAGIGPI